MKSKTIGDIIIYGTLVPCIIIEQFVSHAACFAIFSAQAALVVGMCLGLFLGDRKDPR